MLRLTREDMVKGVRTWWPTLPERKKRVLVISWPGLVLIAPKISWPEGFHPYREEGWGEEDVSFRFSWVEGLGRVIVQEGAPVLALGACLAMPRTSMEKVYARGTVKKRSSLRLGDFKTRRGETVWADLTARERIAASLECDLSAVDLRLAKPSWASRPMILGYRKGDGSKVHLRVVLAAVTDSEVMGR